MKRAAPLCLVLFLAPVAAQAQSFCEAVTADTLVSPALLGDGTPGSVTTAQVQAALDVGGHILFNVGGTPTTITVDAPLRITRAVVLDGAGVVTLSGGGARRIIVIAPQPSAGYTATLQNISFANASVPAGRGAAIFNESGGFWQRVSLKLVNATFTSNAAMQVGQDDGGGALYATGLDTVRIGNCTFTDNSGSNGGAVYSLGSKRVTIVDSDFNQNRATGFGANPGNGGNAGALGIDGADRQVNVCRTRFVGNTSNAHGAGFFSVMYDSTSHSRFEDVVFEGNIQAPSQLQHTGGAYIQDGPFALERVSFLRNEARGFGGLFVTGTRAAGIIRNSTFVGNVAHTGLGGAMAIGQTSPVSIVNTTIANNVATAAFAAGISVGAGNQLRLTNVILANNTGGNAFVSWGINNPASQDGGGNMQWPQARPNGGAEVPATGGVTFANPLLAASDANNGGLVPTIALTAGSPAINTGVSTGEVPATDARGVPRAGAPDRGSFEVNVNFPALSVDDVTVTEGDSGTVNATFTITRSGDTGSTVTVSYTTADGPANLQQTALPSLSVSDVPPPSDGGATTVTFTVSLSRAVPFAVMVKYAAIPGTAVPGSDFAATAGALVFPPGTTRLPVTVPTFAARGADGRKTFSLRLSNATGATVDKAEGHATVPLVR